MSLKISGLDQDKLIEIIGGENSAFYLFADKNLDLIETWLYQNRLVQNGQVERKETSRPYQWIEIILLNHHNIHINNLASIYGFQNLLSIDYRRKWSIEQAGSGTTKFQLGLDFCPRKDETLSFRLQQSHWVYLDPGRIF